MPRQLDATAVANIQQTIEVASPNVFFLARRTKETKKGAGSGSKTVNTAKTWRRGIAAAKAATKTLEFKTRTVLHYEIQ